MNYLVLRFAVQFFGQKMAFFAPWKDFDGGSFLQHGAILFAQTAADTFRLIHDWSVSGVGAYGGDRTIFFAHQAFLLVGPNQAFIPANDGGSHLYLINWRLEYCPGRTYL